MSYQRRLRAWPSQDPADDMVWMPPTEITLTGTLPDGRTYESRYRKAVLFCPSCGADESGRDNAVWYEFPGIADMGGAMRHICLHCSLVFWADAYHHATDPERAQAIKDAIKEPANA